MLKTLPLTLSETFTGMGMVMEKIRIFSKNLMMTLLLLLPKMMTNSMLQPPPLAVHSPLQTRAQRIKNGSKVTPLHKQKKLSKAAKREANALARTSKANLATTKHDPDVYQWNLLLVDQPKRAEEAANIQGNVEHVIAANPNTTNAIICEDNHQWKVTVYSQNIQHTTAPNTDQ
ncbi:hypothetical protein LguiA_030693 [Lonicera macranthoides]